MRHLCTHLEIYTLIFLCGVYYLHMHQGWLLAKKNTSDLVTFFLGIKSFVKFLYPWDFIQAGEKVTVRSSY